MNRVILLGAALIAMPFGSSRAQVIDSVRVGVRPPAPTQRPDSGGPPISPRRAFLSSLLLPGYGQTRLDRSSAAMLFSVLEIGSIGMARKAAQDLREARGISKDSVVSTYVVDPTTGKATIDPKTGLPTPATWIKSRFDAERVKARRVHYEDWVAALIFNHLFSAADAYVAANLWDFRANVGATASATSARVTASFSW